MADVDQHQKTQEASEKRREDARTQGQVVLSAELMRGLGLLAGAGALWFGGEAVIRRLSQVVRLQLSHLPNGSWDHQSAHVLASQFAGYLLSCTGAVLASCFLIALVAGGLQTGFRITLTPLSFNWGRISPQNGLSRLFSSSSLVQGLMATAKATAISILVVAMVRARTDEIGSVIFGSLPVAVASCWTLALQIALTVGGILLMLGMADYGYQWWLNESKLKMTLEEVKAERKDQDGDPHVRARIKKLQREMAKSGMLRRVPQATVVLTNPTHYAVALKYDRQNMKAPIVVAKGADLWAKRIIRIAKENGVPVLERKPLARALYAMTDLNQEIPEVLFAAIAEIIGYVYRMKK